MKAAIFALIQLIINWFLNSDKRNQKKYRDWRVTYETEKAKRFNRANKLGELREETPVSRE